MLSIFWLDRQTYIHRSLLCGRQYDSQEFLLHFINSLLQKMPPKYTTAVVLYTF